MSDREWDEALVRAWLEHRATSARAEQDRADRRGREAEDDYDRAAAEEWASAALAMGDAAATQAGFAARIRVLTAQEEYVRPGVHDDRRFEREVRGCLRRIAKMAKANEGFENRLRFQR
ncbi:hypothetical protein [Sphingomonas adhaesiva]|uniref:hypothetical protein n=1 Tax=Sphingomonas adhaesiva TaxID=28212 RepID=UPI002FF52A5A